MCRTCFESFIRFGGTKTFFLNLASSRVLELKQDGPSRQDAVRQWLDEVWSQTFGATAQAILKTKPFEFSSAGLSDLDIESLRADALLTVQAAIEREGFDIVSADGEQRALAVLSGFLNQAQQLAMQIEFYVWSTRQDSRVREGHAERDDMIFRWDTPPEGGHPTEDFGCRCYARALGIEGYWARVQPSVEGFVADIEEWEGNVDHMYLDTRGFVTVGKGKLLPDSASASALPFRVRATDALASEDAIRTEYDLIDGMEASQTRGAAFYEQFTSLYLPQADIDQLVQDHVRQDFEALLRQYPSFGNLPLSAQIALWDMIYNLGPGGWRSSGCCGKLSWTRIGRKQQSSRIGKGQVRRETGMSSIYSSMRRKKRDWLIGTFAVAACLTSFALAETGTVRIGAHFFPTSEHRYQSLRSVSEIQDQLNADMQQFVTGFSGCPAIIEGPLDAGKPRDPLRDTSTIIQSIRVWCWAILQTDPAAQVSASGLGAEITTELIQGIMTNAEMLAAKDEDWSQTLVTFTDGEITCTDQERCRLSLLDGKEPPEQSVDFDLIMATGDERFVLVTQAIYGRSGFVYGVRWRESEDGGEVISIFPDRL